MTFGKLRKYLGIVYVVCFVAVFLYVYGILTTDSIDVRTKEEKKQTSDTKIVTISLEIINTTGTITQSAKMSNTDSVLDFLDHLRDKNQIFFERTSFIKGYTYDKINNTPTPKGYVWRLFLGEKDITDTMGDINLTDEDKFTFKLIRSEVLQ